MAIFGTEAPKIITTGATTIDIDYSRIIKDEPEYLVTVNKSSFSGNKFFSPHGRYWVFECAVNLFKEADPVAKYTTYLALLHQKVYLYRHRDGNAVKDVSGDDVLFIIDDLGESFLEQYNWNDLLKLRFVSSEFIDTLGE